MCMKYQSFCQLSFSSWPAVRMDKNGWACVMFYFLALSLCVMSCCLFSSLLPLFFPTAGTFSGSQEPLEELSTVSPAVLVHFYMYFVELFFPVFVFSYFSLVSCFEHWFSCVLSTFTPSSIISVIQYTSDIIKAFTLYTRICFRLQSMPAMWIWWPRYEGVYKTTFLNISLPFYIPVCLKLGDPPPFDIETHVVIYYIFLHNWSTSHFFPEAVRWIEGNPLVTTFLSTLWQSLKATVQLPVHILECSFELSSTKAKAADLSTITFPVGSLDISLHLACSS